MLSPRVLILAGGLSHERDVSLRSGRRVADALRDAGCEVTISDVETDLLETVLAGRVDMVWPLLHGASGEDGAVRDVLELVGIPYLGSVPAACRLSWDKSVAKGVVREAGLRTPDFVALPHGIFRELGAPRVLSSMVDRLGLPLVVKPARGGPGWAPARSGCRRPYRRPWSTASPTATWLWWRSTSVGSRWRSP